MMTELTAENKLRFNVKTVSVEDMNDMLKEAGWSVESMHFAENKISADSMAAMLEDLGWSQN